MPQSFHLNEAGYEVWLRRHPDGFAFNHFGGRDPAYNVLHRASCPHLHRPKDEGARTNVPKLCSDDRRELEAAATAVRRGRDGWKHCSTCLGE
jgi:hypothetical protein